MLTLTWKFLRNTLEKLPGVATGSSALLMRMITLDITVIILLSTFKLIKGQFGNNIFNFLLNSLKHWHWIPKIQAVYLSLINTHVVTIHSLIAHFSIFEPL